MHSKASDQNTDTYDEKGGDKEQKRLQKWQDRLYMIKKKQLYRSKSWSASVVLRGELDEPTAPTEH